MGAKNPSAQYSYSDVTLSLFGNSLSQGEYLANLAQFKNKFCSQISNGASSPLLYSF